MCSYTWSLFHKCYRIVVVVFVDSPESKIQEMGFDNFLCETQVNMSAFVSKIIIVSTIIPDNHNQNAFPEEHFFHWRPLRAHQPPASLATFADKVVPQHYTFCMWSLVEINTWHGINVNLKYAYWNFPFLSCWYSPQNQRLGQYRTHENIFSSAFPTSPPNELHIPHVSPWEKQKSLTMNQEKEWMERKNRERGKMTNKRMASSYFSLRQDCLFDKIFHCLHQEAEAVVCPDVLYTFTTKARACGWAGRRGMSEHTRSGWMEREEINRVNVTCTCMFHSLWTSLRVHKWWLNWS